MITNNGSIDNLISIEMVDKLRLSKIPHLTPYRVSCMEKGALGIGK